PAHLRRVLEETGVPANRVELEVTESMVMQNAEQTTHVLNEMREIGVSLAIDDFGTGYSSLVYLKRLPIDTLKIDKEFIAGLPMSNEDRAIVRTIVSLAAAVGVTTIAEGVETVEQMEAC